MRVNALIAGMRASGQLSPAPRREHELRELTWRNRAVIHLLILDLCDHGLAASVVRSRREKIDGEWTLIELPSPGPGEPLTIEEAGRLLGFCKANKSRDYQRGFRKVSSISEPLCPEKARSVGF